MWCSFTHLNASGESVLLSRRVDKNGDKCANTRGMLLLSLGVSVSPSRFKITSLYTEHTEIVSIPLLFLFERENRGSVNRL